MITKLGQKIAKSKSKKDSSIQKGLSKPQNTKQNFNGVSLGKDKDGFFVYTHRARSNSYESPEKIPQGRIDFIESTG